MPIDNKKWALFAGSFGAAAVSWTGHGWNNARNSQFHRAKIISRATAGYTFGQTIQAIQQVAHDMRPRDYQLGWNGAAYQQKQFGQVSIIAYGFGIIMIFLILAARACFRGCLSLAIATGPVSASRYTAGMPVNDARLSAIVLAVFCVPLVYVSGERGTVGLSRGHKPIAQGESIYA